MYSASSNLHRERRPNHLLQWTGMRWAKAHDCTLYDFRAIAERLEPDEPDYSLYTYKEGFGGYSVLTLQGHDLAYDLPRYWAYRSSLVIKRALVHRRFARRARLKKAASSRNGHDEMSGQAASGGGRAPGSETAQSSRHDRAADSRTASRAATGDGTEGAK